MTWLTFPPHCARPCSQLCPLLDTSNFQHPDSKAGQRCDVGTRWKRAQKPHKFISFLKWKPGRHVTDWLYRLLNKIQLYHVKRALDSFIPPLLFLARELKLNTGACLPWLIHATCSTKCAWTHEKPRTTSVTIKAPERRPTLKSKKNLDLSSEPVCFHTCS